MLHLFLGRTNYSFGQALKGSVIAGSFEVAFDNGIFQSMKANDDEDAAGFEAAMGCF
eukprot:m.259291 g.259291  ORF g.259291 m.259291 type:complete len:57 (-) comp19204_c0_seq1:1356-1526(-)